MMADSSHHGKAPRKESFSEQYSSSNMDSSPPPPHMMYYPPGTGYPPGHAMQSQPYHPYPPAPGYAPYPAEYSQPHGHNNYPGNPYYGVPQTYHSGGGARGFIRGFIMCSCIIFTGFFVATLVVALMLHPELPVFKVTSLSVANFNTTPVLTGDWNISVTVENPNERLKGFFSDFKVELVHDNDVVAVSSVPDFELDKHELKQMDVKAASTGAANGVSFQKWDLDEIAKERGTGTVNFALRVPSLATFKSSSLSTKNAFMIAICEGLKVVFQNNTNTGTLDNQGKPITCQLYM